jgi:choline kinase
MKAVILAAGMGTRLLPLTADRPKPLVEIAGRSLLLRLVDQLAGSGIRGRDVIVVGGFREDALHQALAGTDAVIVHNPRYADWNNFWSLYVARQAVGDDGFLQIDGDLLIDDRVIPRVLAAPGPGVLAVKVDPETDAEAMKAQVDGRGQVVALSKKVTPADALGESIGIARVDPPLAGQVFAELEALAAEGITGDYYERAYERLLMRGEGPFRIVDVSDCLGMEIDDPSDLARAEAAWTNRLA